MNSSGAYRCVVDHIKAQACGGADDPHNMQWQTTAAAKQKDSAAAKGDSKRIAKDTDGVKGVNSLIEMRGSGI